MESDRFDKLTRRLATGISRRGAVTTLAVISGWELGGLENVDAKKKKEKKCPKACKAPQVKCTKRCHKCCPDSLGNPRVCELVPVCPESADGKYCCGKEGVECGQDCDCCGDLVCPNGECCVSFGTVCTETTACCGACEGGTCCSNQGGECESIDDCCGDLECVGANQGVQLGSCETPD